jgi:hypothetical protein
MTSRIRILSLVMLSAPLLACSISGSTTGTGAARFTSLPTTFPPQDAPYFISRRSVFVDTDYVDRYACPDGLPLVCERTSRISTATCTCR